MDKRQSETSDASNSSESNKTKETSSDDSNVQYIPYPIITHSEAFTDQLVRDHDALKLENAILASQMEELLIWVEELCKRLAMERADAVRDQKRWTLDRERLESGGAVAVNAKEEAEVLEMDVRRERQKEEEKLSEGLMGRLAWCRGWAVNKHKKNKEKARRKQKLAR